MRKGNLVAATVLVLAGLGCNFSIGAGTTPVANDVLFQDDFSDTGSGWDRASTDTGVSDYQDGGYHISVSPTYSSVWANPGKSFTDVSVEVDGHKLSGVDDNEYGLLCRYQDVDNFYGASISSDGFYGFFKLENGNFGYLGTDKMVTSDAIHKSSESNHIRLDCVGSTLTLYINGAMVSSTSDGTFHSGDVGLYAGTFATTDIDIFFDNFVVRQP